MRVETATSADAEALTELRLAYLRDDHGDLDEETENTLRRCLPEYFREHLNRDLFAFAAREGGTIVSCAFLLLVEKPMSPAFMNGKTGQVLNVYTRPSSRRKGYARSVMLALLSKAEELGLSPVELKATEEGYPLYRSVGFEDDQSEYRHMKRKYR